MRWPYVTQYPFFDFAGPVIVDSFMLLGLTGGFWILDISNPSQPIKAGEILHWGHLCAMEKRGDLLYCADREKCFRIFLSEVAQVRDRGY